MGEEEEEGDRRGTRIHHDDTTPCPSGREVEEMMLGDGMTDGGRSSVGPTPVAKMKV